MAPSALPGNESAPSPLAAAASDGVGPIAPAACHKSSNGRDPRLATAAAGNVPWRSGSSTKPSATGTPPMACASRLSPSGRLSPSVLISARPVTDPSRRASAAGERSSGSANSTSIAIAAGRPAATASTIRAIVSRGHGQVPNASMDARSMSTTITFRSDGAGLRSHWSPAAWTTLLPVSQRSPAVRFDYCLWAFSASLRNNHQGPYRPCFDPLGRQLGGQSLTLGTRPAGRLRVGSGLPLGCRHRTLSEEHSHQRRIDDFRHFATFKIVRPQAPSILGQYRQIVLSLSLWGPRTTIRARPARSYSLPMTHYRG